MWQLALAIVAVLLARPDSTYGGATTIPEFRLGSCGTGAGAPPCGWSCDQTVFDNPICREPVCGDASEPRCADDTTPWCLAGGQLACADDSTPTCQDTSVPTCQTSALTCQIDAVETFTAHAVVRLDDEPCKTAGPGGTDVGGAVVEIGLRGTREDGVEFTVPSRTIDLCSIDNGCGGCDPDVCSELDASCPLSSIFHCEVLPPLGQPEFCPPPASDTNRRLCETDLSGLSGWLAAGKQPLLPLMYADLASLFPSAVGLPYVTDVTPLVEIDHAGDAAPSIGHYCLVFSFLADGKPTPVPPSVALAPTSASSLVVRGDCHCPPSPRTDCESAFGAGLLLVNEERPGREKLVAKWLEGPALAASALGNPLDDGGTRYDLCVYGESGALAGQYTVDRAGDTCGSNACWKNLGAAPGSPEHKGYRYKDKATTGDGMLALLVKGGEAGKSKVVAKGKNNAPQGQTSLPLGTAAALTGSSTATIQLLGTGAPDCVSLTLDTVLKDSGARFKASR